MSRLYFSSPSGEAELAGPERHWLWHVAKGPAVAAWDLGDLIVSGSVGKDRIARIMSMIPTPKFRDYRGSSLSYLHDKYEHFQKALGTGYGPAAREFSEILLRHLSVPSFGNEQLVVGEHTVAVINVGLNTAIACGAPPIQLAAKLAGWTFTFTEGKDRAWLADVIEHGCLYGPYRNELPRQNSEATNWNMGWDRVMEFLRSNDTDPVVTHHSTDESFPDPEYSTWRRGVRPEGWRPEHWSEGDWDKASDDGRDEAWADFGRDQWYDQPVDLRWAQSMDWMRQHRPWARLSPETLGNVFFGPPVTVYDLLAPDHVARVERAFGKKSDAA